MAAQYWGADDVLLVCSHLTTSGKAVRCVGLCSALRWLMQRVAMADAMRCDGECSAVLRMAWICVGCRAIC